MSKINYKVISKNGPILSGYYWIVQNIATGMQFKVIGYPFENCQTFLISAIKNALPSGFGPVENVMDLLREIRDTAGVGQNLCQIDIKRDVFDRIKPYIKIHSSMDYVNLTGNQMVNLLIDLRQ